MIFEAGKHYNTEKGVVVGPLEASAFNSETLFCRVASIYCHWNKETGKAMNLPHYMTNEICGSLTTEAAT